MFVEIHVLQNFAPSNLNRDDTGSPKDCEFGGHRRARVSSQCWKRAVRECFQSEVLLPKENLAVRTKRLVGTLANRLQESEPKPTAEDALAVAAAAVNSLGVGLDQKSGAESKTSVLLFLGNDQIDKLEKICKEHWNELLPADAEDKKKKSTADLPKDLVKKIKESLQASGAVDLALFGRMIAEDPVQNVEAACQVAHAISTHRVAPEFDYYTAVDDLAREDETGAGMVGTQEFNSACFYRYANVNLDELAANLGGDRELALAGVRAFLQSFIVAIPKAKQNSSAAQCLPSFVMLVVREKGLWSLANAFLRPADGRGKGLMVNSIESLAKHWGNLKAMYGDRGIRRVVVATLEDAPLDGLEESRRGGVAAALDEALAALGEGR